MIGEEEEAVIIDVTERPIERLKKNRRTIIQGRKERKQDNIKI